MNISDYNDYGYNTLTEEKNQSSGSLSPFTFILVTMVLTLSGLLMLYSASYPEAIMHGLPHYYYFIRQAFFALAGLAVAVIINFIPLKWIKLSVIPILLISLIMMLLTLFSPWGVTVLGAKRWLNIPHLPSFQPSEIAKIAMILFLAWWFTEPRCRVYIGWFYVVPLALIMLFSLLIVAQKAYTTTILFLLISLVMCIYGRLKLRYIISFLAFMAVPGCYLILSESYRVKRVASYLFPNLDPSGLNWQVSTSLSAIREGGFFGKGLGKGEYKAGLLPEVQNDFIFSSIAEETGLCGILLIFACFILFAILGYRAAKRLEGKNSFYAALTVGITSMIIFQVIINVAVVTGLLPPTGIPLPFFSQGGTNLFVILAECGLLYKAISASCKGNVL